MTLIVAIEPDRRQANYLSAMVRGRLKADLVLAESAEDALRALAGRVPDVILTSALLSPKDEAAIAEWLRSLDTAAAHVQTLTIPMFAPSKPRPQRVRGMFSAFMGADDDQPAAAPDGCDPAMFAEQCADYLERARAKRADNGDLDENSDEDKPIETPLPQRAAPEVPQEAPREVRAAMESKPEFEFDLSSFFEAVKTEPLDPPVVEESEPDADAEDLPPAAPSSDIWVAPRVETRRRTSMEIPTAAVRAVAPRPQPTARRVPRSLRPVQDEWGFFDPDQAGFAALLAKLAEITEGDDPPSKRPA
ncbi:MAG TPA: hypothetical protein VEU08_19240 [Vicinamibacterales bacterium]|nr:hypothetical protein [Vicinamibacterales bacterium]